MEVWNHESEDPKLSDEADATFRRCFHYLLDHAKLLDRMGLPGAACETRASAVSLYDVQRKLGTAAPPVAAQATKETVH